MLLKIAIIICMSPFIAAGVFVYIFIMDKKKSKKKSRNSNVVELAENLEDAEYISQIKKTFGIKAIYNDSVKLLNGNLSRILSISSPDFELLTEEEQSAFENQLMQFSLSINFPVIWHTTSRKVETEEPVKIIAKNLEDNSDETIPEGLRQYSEKLRNNLIRIENIKGVYVRKSYCVVMSEFIQSDSRTYKELEARVEKVRFGLNSARMKVSLLDTYKTAQILSDILNRQNSVDIEKFVQNGALELYAGGRVIFDDKSLKKEAI